jgi:hypothetical protein
MFLTSKEGNDEMNFDAEINDRDLIKDVEYCPFCNRDSDIVIIHPKAREEENQPESERGGKVKARFTFVLSSEGNYNFQKQKKIQSLRIQFVE